MTELIDLFDLDPTRVVARLRHRAEFCDPGDSDGRLLIEAAREIDRLRNGIAILILDLDDQNMWTKQRLVRILKGNTP